MSKSLNDYQYESLNAEPFCYRGTVVIETPGSSGTHTFTEGGWAKYITLGVGEMEGTGTATFEIIDVAGGTVFSQARVEKGTANYASAVPFGTAFSLVVTADGTQSADATAIFAIHFER